MLTRSVAKDCMARAVFEQPPGTRRDSAKYPVRKRKRQRRFDPYGISLLLVFKTPLLWWTSIKVCRRRLMQQRFRKRMFVAQITEVAC